MLNVIQDAYIKHKNKIDLKNLKTLLIRSMSNQQINIKLFILTLIITWKDMLTWHRFPISWKICSFSSGFRSIVPLCLSVLPDFMLSPKKVRIKVVKYYSILGRSSFSHLKRFSHHHYDINIRQSIAHSCNRTHSDDIVLTRRKGRRKLQNCIFVRVKTSNLPKSL